MALVVPVVPPVLLVLLGLPVLPALLVVLVKNRAQTSAAQQSSPLCGKRDPVEKQRFPVAGTKCPYDTLRIPLENCNFSAHRTLHALPKKPAYVIPDPRISSRSS